MYKYYALGLTAAAALFSKAIAADCNPLKETDCKPDPGLSTSTYSVDFTAGADETNWESVGGGNVTYSSSGAEFTINKQGDSPTLQTAWRIFFGRIEVHMKAAPGTGIISCAILMSDDLDEVDWEFIGGSPDEVQTNYFGKGDSSSSGRSSVESVDDTQATSHNYTLYWTEEALSWYIDGSLKRTRTYSEAASGAEYPQTPSRVKLGIWAGGDPNNAAGTIAWAGGETDYSKGPYTMIVESVEITNFNPANNYTYSDKTGDYTSIKFDAASDSSSDTDTTTSSAKQPTSTAAPTIASTKASEVVESHTSTTVPAAVSTQASEAAEPHTSTTVPTAVSTQASEVVESYSTAAPTAVSTKASDGVEPPTATESAGSSSGSGDHSGYGWQSGHHDHEGWGHHRGHGGHRHFGHGGHKHFGGHSGKGKYRFNNHYSGNAKGKGPSRKMRHP